MKWLVLDGYVATAEQMTGRDIWNHMCHVQKISQWGGLVVIKYFSLYGQCFRRCEDVSNFPKNWGEATGMEPGSHGATYIINPE